MAIIIPTVENIETLNDKGVLLYTWAGMATADVGAAVEVPGHADRSVQVDGTFGGASVNIEGSNGPVATPVWAALNDPSSAALAFTTAKIEAVLEVTRFIRPNVVGGAGSGLRVQLLVRRPMR